MAVGIWNMTSDTGVATFFCVITDERFGEHSGAGAGTHVDAGIALSRAISEAVQVRTNYITGARDDLEHEEYALSGIAQKERYAESLFNAESAHLTDFSAIASNSFDSFEEDVDWLLGSLSKVGIQEVVSVDLTKPEIGIPVQRIVIPGLEGPHDHQDYCAGPRAYAHIAGNGV